jgi:NAD(P)-dependent dehydrogenase (short-subunit alcohol dehydrogenase family)
MPAAPARGWALVTGGARRIGRALALAAAQAGYDVVVHARSDDDGRETAEAVRALQRRSEVVAADLALPDVARTLIADRHAPLTLLVNCASVFEDDRLETTTAQALDRAFEVNVRAPALLAQAFAAATAAEADNLIVNILDQRVLRLDPRYFSYSVSRAALWGATQMMAQALGPRVRVNAIGPGPTLASIHQSQALFDAEVRGTLLQRAVAPEDIAQALRYLIDARAVTGQLIAVDSGQHLGWETPDVVDSGPPTAR